MVWGVAMLQAPPPKAVWLLGADDFDEADVPTDAFVVYQVLLLTFARLHVLCFFSPVRCLCSYSPLLRPYH